MMQHLSKFVGRYVVSNCTNECASFPTYLRTLARLVYMIFKMHEYQIGQSITSKIKINISFLVEIPTNSITLNHSCRYIHFKLTDEARAYIGVASTVGEMG